MEERRPVVIVVDANVLVYLWAGGPGAELAGDVLRRDSAWSAPLLWRSEFRNAMVQLLRARRVTADRALSFTREAELQMARREYGISSHAVLALALGSGCSSYDCEYVALAEELDVPLVTFDAEVLRAFPERALAPEAFLRD